MTANRLHWFTSVQAIPDEACTRCFPPDVDFRLWKHAAHWASTPAVNATHIQRGKTGSRPKLDLGHEPYPLTNYCWHRNRYTNRCFAFVARRTRWADLDGDLRTYLAAHPEADRTRFSLARDSYGEALDQALAD